MKLNDTKKITIENSWISKESKQKPLVIAGPCSAETETQLLGVAQELKNSSVSYFRAGLWKPRTRPGNFEGVGTKGLAWLNQVKKETGLKVATEVANAKHVEKALENDIDMLWIGARSTVSPFIVQEIAEALKGTKKIVLVKNPVNPDLALWMGALERLHKMNITNLGAIHRGFSAYKKSKYRNNPEWQIPIDFKSNFPDTPMFLDPSHIAGNRTLLFDLCQTALELNYSGLMVETHQEPDNAWSDAQQQITPEALFQLLDKLQVRKKESNTYAYTTRLEQLRSVIDAMDEQMVEALGKRMQIAHEIGILKQENNVSILQSDRWNELLESKMRQGEALELSEMFIEQIFKAIHQESIKQQKKIQSKK